MQSILLALCLSTSALATDVLDVLDPGRRELSHQYTLGGAMCSHNEFACVGSDNLPNGQNRNDVRWTRCCAQCNKKSGGSIGKNNCRHNSQWCKCSVCYGTNPESPYGCNLPTYPDPTPSPVAQSQLADPDPTALPLPAPTRAPTTTTTTFTPTSLPAPAPSALPLPSPSALPLPAPSALPTAEPTSFKEETCDGQDLHRFPSLEACCDDLGLPGHQEDLTDFLTGLDDAWGETETMGAKCVAEGYPKQP